MDTKEIYLAGGCFWGTEHLMKQLPGVVGAEAGYANSRVPSPSYQEVCTGRTGAAETVRVVYDPGRLTLPFLLDMFYRSIDPSRSDGQGNDIGSQYRPGVYYTDPADSAAVESSLQRLVAKTGRRVAVERGPLENFYPAEEYHQDYLDKNPGGYCHVNPRLFDIAAASVDPGAPANRFPRPTDTELKKRLSALQYMVTRENATEHPYTNEYDREFRPGIYVDIVTGQPLFVSDDKFQSGCGWPAFSRPISPGLLTEVTDTSHGMTRTEVRSTLGDSHLGHVFTDGPASSGGLRYCINSASLRFIPLDSMAAEGYADFVPLVKRH